MRSRTVVGARDGNPRPRLAPLGRRQAEMVTPPGLDQLLGLAGTGVPADQHRDAILERPGQQHLAGMGVRRPLLGVQVVTVVPDGDEPEAADRGERRTTGADHSLDVAACQRQEGGVPRGRTEVGAECDVVADAEPGRQCAVQPGEVACVRHTDDGAATGVEGGQYGLGDRLLGRRTGVAPQHARGARPAARSRAKAAPPS
ncbi:MAG: hypothetical protein WKF83_07185 [Nocardioidaceae bacterium]